MERSREFVYPSSPSSDRPPIPLSPIFHQQNDSPSSPIFHQQNDLPSSPKPIMPTSPKFNDDPNRVIPITQSFYQEPPTEEEQHSNYNMGFFNSNPNEYTVRDDIIYVKHYLYKKPFYEIPPAPRNPSKAIYKIWRIVDLLDLSRMNIINEGDNNGFPVYFYTHFSPMKLSAYGRIDWLWKKYMDTELPPKDADGFHILMIPGYQLNHHYFYMITNQNRIVFKSLNVFQENSNHSLKDIRKPLHFRDEKYVLTPLEYLRTKRLDMTNTKEQNEHKRIRNKDQQHKVTKEKWISKLTVKLQEYEQELNKVNHKINSNQEKINELQKSPKITVLQKRKLDGYTKQMETLQIRKEEYSELIQSIQSDIRDPRSKEVKDHEKAKKRLDDALEALKNPESSKLYKQKGKRNNISAQDLLEALQEELKIAQKACEKTQKKINKMIAKENKDK